jgi:hypothetical protein
MAETEAAAAKRVAPFSASAGPAKAKKVKLETYIHVLNADSVAKVTNPYIGVNTLQNMATADGREAIMKALGDKMTPFKYSVLEKFGDHVAEYQSIADNVTVDAEMMLHLFSTKNTETWNGLLGIEQEYNEAKKTASSSTRNNKANMAKYAAANAAAKTELESYIAFLKSEMKMEETVAPIDAVVDILEKVVHTLTN